MKEFKYLVRYKTLEGKYRSYTLEASNLQEAKNRAAFQLSLYVGEEAVSVKRKKKK